MNKTGGLLDLIVLMIVGFVATLFFVGWIYANNQLTDTLLSIESPSANITQATEATFVKINEALGGLKWLAAAMIFGSIIAIMVSNFLVKAHPVFLMPYLLFVIISIVFSAYISNAYEDILSGGILASTLQEFSFVNFFFLNLPIWITVIGVMGAIMLFIGVTVDKELGGSLG